jgi:hypothetical protein
MALIHEPSLYSLADKTSPAEHLFLFLFSGTTWIARAGLLRPHADLQPLSLSRLQKTSKLPFVPDRFDKIFSTQRPLERCSFPFYPSNFQVLW